MLKKEQMIEKLIQWNTGPNEVHSFWNHETLDKQPLNKIRGMYQTYRNKIVKNIITKHIS